MKGIDYTTDYLGSIKNDGFNKTYSNIWQQ